MSTKEQKADYIERIIQEIGGRRHEQVRIAHGTEFETVLNEHGKTSLCVLESARAKDAELIQTLVDALWGRKDICEEALVRRIALATAAAAGFTPTEQP